jgi:hypothetical protein
MITNIQENAKIELIDALGNVMRKTYAETNQVNMNVEGLASGNYFVRIVSDESTALKSVIIR